MNFFTKLFSKKSCKQKALELLKKSADQGDIESQQILNFHKTFENSRCPIHSTINVLNNNQVVDTVVKVVNTSTKNKKSIKKSKRHQKSKSDNNK